MTPRRARSPNEARARRAETNDPNVVMDAAAAFLSVRPRSVAEVRRRLRHLGYRHELVEQAVERLVEFGYLDDEAFARGWVESRDRARPRGEAALRRELSLKGVDRATVDALLEERSGQRTGDPASAGAGGADRAAAERLLARRRATLEREQDPVKRRQKEYALLARKGFDPKTCMDVSRAFVTAEGERLTVREARA